MKKILYLLFICLFALTATSCDKYSIFGNSWVTVEYDYTGYKYKNLKITYNGNEFHSIGRYKVPEGSIVKLEWYWESTGVVPPPHGNASYEVSAIGSMNIVILRDQAKITFKNK